MVNLQIHREINAAVTELVKVVRPSRTEIIFRKGSNPFRSTFKPIDLGRLRYSDRL
jgi:hypothetical protein